MHFLKKHATSDDDADSGEHTESAVDILVVANEVSKHKEAANGIKQKTALINQGAGIKRKDQSTRESAAERPDKEYEVQDPESIAEYTFGGSKPRSKHADNDGKDNDSDDEEVEAADEDGLSERDKKCTV